MSEITEYIRLRGIIMAVYERLGADLIQSMLQQVLVEINALEDAKTKNKK